MRVDHFVIKPPLKNLYRGATMAISNTPKTTTQTIKTGDTTMSHYPQNTPSITKSRGFGSSHMTWVRTQQKDSNLVYGRIRDTGVNFIVEGYRSGIWVSIPCQNLPSAQLLLGDIMPKATHKREKAHYDFQKAHVELYAWWKDHSIV